MSLASNRIYGWEVARGRILGEAGLILPGRKDGISNTVLDDLTQIPSTTVAPDPGGIQLEVVSSSANDADEGTGIQQVDIHYLDTAGASQNETVVLDGTTPVDTVATDIDVVQWMHAQVVGSGGVAAGNITLRNTGDTIDFEYIAAGGNQSLAARYQVPTGKIAYILGWQASAITAAKIIDFRLRATVMRDTRTLLSGVFLFQDAVVLNASASPWIMFPIPLKCPAGAKIKISALGGASGGDAGAQFAIWQTNA